MKHFYLILFLITGFFSFAQEMSNFEKYPVFKECNQSVIDELPNCFKDQVKLLFQNKFNIPEVVLNDDYNGYMDVLFEVTDKGVFKVIYINAAYSELKQEVEKVFSLYPEIQPATYDGKNVFTQYKIQVQVPSLEWGVSNKKATKDLNKLEQATLEYDSIVNLGKAESKLFNSGLNIPFSHQNYARFDFNLNLLGTNSHTAIKPYSYADIVKYYDFESNLSLLKKDKKIPFKSDRKV